LLAKGSKASSQAQARYPVAHQRSNHTRPTPTLHPSRPSDAKAVPPGMLTQLAPAAPSPPVQSDPTLQSLSHVPTEVPWLSPSPPTPSDLMPPDRVPLMVVTPCYPCYPPPPTGHQECMGPSWGMTKLALSSHPHKLSLPTPRTMTGKRLLEVAGGCFGGLSLGMG